MSVKLCGTCGAELEAGAMFCAECGARVQAAPASTPPVPPAPVAPAPSVTASGPAPAPAAPATPAGPAAPGGRRDARGVGAFPVVPGSVAPVGRRVAAYAIDVVALFLLAGAGVLISLAVAGPPEAGATPSAVSFLPHVLAGLGGLTLWVGESVTGATLGGAMLGIRTVSAETGRPAGLLRIFVRQLVVGLGSIACGVGSWLVAASGVFDKSPAQRGWHDKAAGTIVLLANATGVARSEDPAQAWDRAVARAVGPVPPPPPSPAPASAPPPAPVAQAPVVAPAASAPAVAAPVIGTPAATTPAAGSVDASVPPAATDVPSANEPEPSPTISLVPLPPGVGTGRPTERPPAGGLITGPPVGAPAAPGTTPTSASTPASTPDSAPSPAAGPASPAATAATSGWSDALAGEARRASGDTPPSGHDQVEPPRKPAETTATAAQPIVRFASEHPRWTEELDDIELTRLRTPVTGLPPVPPGLRLVFDTGERVDVMGDGVVGRAPQGEVPHVVAIDDPARSLSKTHLAFGPAEPGTLWVVDRGSTNGTLVVRPDGTAATLPAGTRATVGPGWSLRLGERTVRVEAR